MTLRRTRISAVIISFVSLAMAQLACIPQDCMGSTFSVYGHVIDAGKEPIPGATVRVFGDASYEKPAFDVTVTSDAKGAFKSADVFRYSCSSFRIEATAPGYVTWQVKYYPPNSDGNDPQLPGDLIIMLGKIQTP